MMLQRSFVAPLATALLATAATFARPQDPAPADAPLPPGVAARIDDELISFAEYQAYLLRIYGAGPLQDLILTRLFEREAARLGIALDESELDLEIERFWDGYVRRFRGDAQALERELSASGFTVDTYRAKMREELRRDALEARIIVASREITADALRARFDLRYGLGGVKVEVRHILFTAARAKADLQRRGVPEAEIDDARIATELDTSAARALARLQAGEDFATVARTESHDTSVHQNAGVIPGYNYDRYGDAFAAAVRAAEVGLVTGPVSSPIGRHLIEVVTRTTTKLADVADEIAAELFAEPPTWQERNALRARLHAGARVQTYR